MIDILHAIKMLDAPQKCKTLEKRIAALTGKRVKESKIQPYKKKLH
jgi:hypothetical protein